MKLFENLEKRLINLSSFALAFSGGVDSTFLLYSLARIFKLKVKAFTIKTPYIPQWEVNEAISFCRKYNIDHEVVNMPFHESIISNPQDRCYRCKKLLFSRIKEYAEVNKFNIIVDGSNADDTSDYRPGMRALEELKIMSPLLLSGISKAEIREQLKEWGLEIWNKPAYACLLTRIPHDIIVDEDTLSRIEKAELYIKNLGFPGTRVRVHGEVARLECFPQHISELSDDKLRAKIIKELKLIGFKYISLDLEGYRTGSLNIVNNNK